MITCVFILAERQPASIMAKKQAVIVVHGMGEQRPMETLKAIVKTVWQKDSNVAGGRENDIWIKPDTRAGLQELRRITTGADENGKRTDFYEFYWADLMQGNTWQHLTSWISGLLLRSPVSVPRDVLFVWMVIWLIAIMIVLEAIVSVLKIEGITGALCERGQDGFLCTMIGQSKIWSSSLDDAFSSSAMQIILVLILIAVIYKYFPPRAFLHPHTWLSIPLFIIIAVAAAIFVELILYSGSIMIVLTAGFAYLVHSFLVPYFGDVARYVEASPANVGRRKAIRDRGLALFRELHKCGNYDRIIVVSHSLGSIIAYDLINMLWSEIGPNRDQRPSTTQRQKFEKLDKWLVAVWKGEKEGNQAEYRTMQREIFEALRTPTAPGGQETENVKTRWLISDFITFGSPLTHAEFLLARDDTGLEKFIAERTLPTSPPVLEPVEKEGNIGSFLYQESKSSIKLPHHAAVFSAVRWTNIFDKHHPIFFLLGDVISGPVAPLFGDWVRLVGKKKKPAKDDQKFGIEDIRVRIPKWRFFVIPRIFTHTSYWIWNDKWNDGPPPDHIAKLRSAINLLDK